MTMGKAPQGRGGLAANLRRHWLVYAAVLVVAGVAWTISTNVQDSRADGRARDAAVAARADEVSKLTQGGITIYDKSQRAYKWDDYKLTLGVRVRVGQCDVDGTFSLPARPKNTADISRLRFTIPGDTDDAPSVHVEVTKDKLSKIYATLRVSGMRQCIAGDSRFFADVNG